MSVIGNNHFRQSIFSPVNNRFPKQYIQTIAFGTKVSGFSLKPVFAVCKIHNLIYKVLPVILFYDRR